MCHYTSTEPQLGKGLSYGHLYAYFSYLTTHIKAKWARLFRSSIRSILLALDIVDGC